MSAGIGVDGKKEWSVHVTSLPFRAEQHEIVAYFREAGGVDVTSARLVFDMNSHTGRKEFRGVAFLVVRSEADVNKALKLHRSSFGSRSINVRRTVSKEEIAEIADRGMERKKRLRDEQEHNSLGGVDKPVLSKRARRKARKRNQGGAMPELHSEHVATVVSKAPYGLFCSLPHFKREGLLHSTKFLEGKDAASLEAGATVRVKVIEVGTKDAKGRVKIALKQI